MKQIYVQHIAAKLNISQKQVEKTGLLLQQGATIPFISRYRKEVTGSLDEVEISNIYEFLESFNALEQRKETVKKTLKELNVLTAEIEAKIDAIISSIDLEDLYLPYKPKRKTKASIAKANGLEPLAQKIYAQKNGLSKQEAQSYISENCPTIDGVLQGARDIIAEWISEKTQVRNIVRKHFLKSAKISSKVVKTKIAEGEKYEQYFDFSESLQKAPSHRILALMRANNEGILRLSISVPEEYVMGELKKEVLCAYNDFSYQVNLALEDSYKRLVKPSIETEFYNIAKQKADEDAIKVFAKNLRQLLMLPPLGQKKVLAIDPGFRTGCKVVCLNEFGDLLHNETIYPHAPQNEDFKAKKKITQLVATYKIEAIAIGNGTASRETENFIKKVAMPHEVQVYVVSEAGASVYSASKVAREEFPQFDVTVRGSVSIGRRLADPLAELVKIDPKSIGVGQYQHDVNQTNLQTSLDRVVESCVNQVGVELNTASKHLLSYVSGIGPALAENIVAYRKENGAYSSRKELLKVPKMGAKTFEQCAGFVRVAQSENPLDNSAVHPERYVLVGKMAKDLNLKLEDLVRNEQNIKQIQLEKYVSADIGMPTLKDIITELQKPGRDPREKLETFSFDDTIKVIGDLHEGMILPGIVTNITNFGAFVDIGIKQNGLVHLSQIADAFITNPADVLNLNQHVRVKVVSVDTQKQRIQLQMKGVSQS